MEIQLAYFLIPSHKIRECLIDDAVYRGCNINDRTGTC